MKTDKKKDDLSDQQAVYQKRKAPRYDLSAGASIVGFEGEGALNNISITGCCMESATYVSLIPDETYNVTIIPGQEAKLSPFSQNLKVTWTKSSEMLFQAGFTIEGGTKNTQMEKYVNLLNSLGAKPDYGTA